MSNEPSVKLRVSPEVARLVAKDAPRDLQLAAAKGTQPLPDRDLVTVLYFLCHGTDTEIRGHAVHTLRTRPLATLTALLTDPAAPSQLLHFVAQVRIADAELLELLLDNPAVTAATLQLLASRCEGAALLALLSHYDRWQELPAVVAAIQANPHFDPEQHRLFLVAAGIVPPVEIVSAAEPVVEEPVVDADDEEAAATEGGEEEEVNASKYQLALEMGVSEKIKMALTGDKEWRSIFLKDPNKLVSGAALKNPRITEGEVLALAKLKTTSDELIRIILLNKEWVKNIKIRTALVTHPKTPIAQALRFMSCLTDKDLKILAKSKGVSQILVNSARRTLTEKDKKK